MVLCAASHQHLPAMESDSQHVFDEREISAILKRAAEIQGTEGASPVFGLSLAELQQLAAEAGIDPRSVATAAAELRRADANDRLNIWGGPLTMTLDRVLEGEISQEAWEAMVAATRRTFNNTGTVQSWGQTLEWTHGRGTASTQAHVTVTARNGRTHLQVFWNDQVMAAPFYAITGALSLILIPVVFEALGMVSLQGALLFLSLVASIFLLARWLLSRVAGKEKRKVRDLAAQLEQIAAEHTRSSEVAHLEQPVSSPVPAQPILSLDLEESAQDHTETLGRRAQAGSAPGIPTES